MTLLPFRASKPGSLLSIIPCKSSGLRPQVEFRGKAQTKWALGEISKAQFAVALVDHDGKYVAKSAAWPS